MQKLHLILIYAFEQFHRWWKNLQLQADFSFSRDRIVENYFWMVGAYFEPSYSRAPIILTMVMATAVILDDFYDSYASSEECELFTKCIEWFVFFFFWVGRWGSACITWVSCIKKLAI